MKEKILNKSYVLIMLIFGMLLVFLSPPLSVPDENTHFINAYCTSQLNLFPDKGDSSNGVGKYLPQYIADFTNQYSRYAGGDFDKKYSFRDAYFDSWLPVDDTNRSMIFWENNLTTINFGAYIVSGFGMKICSILSLVCGENFDTAYNLMLAGRTANLLFYVLICYLAILITPCLKKTMMLLTTMPMSIYLAASLSYDAILIPICLLFFAEFMKLYLETDEYRINKVDFCIVLLCTYFMAAIKMAYLPFIILLLGIKQKKFGKIKNYIISIMAVGGMVIIGLVLPKIGLAIATKNIEQTVDNNILIQKDYLLQHIIYIPHIIGKSFYEYKNFYLSSFVGKFGQLDTNLPVIYIVLFALILILVALVEGLYVGKVNVKIKILALFVVTAIITGMFLAMYVNWTPLVEEPRGITVSGIQGRYFIPIYCFLFIFLFSDVKSRISSKINLCVEHTIYDIAVFFIIFNPLLTSVVILLRYWN